MKRWYVVTPEYDYTEIIVDGQGPTYTERDVIEIEAETARDAIALGVREMLTRRRSLDGWRYQWCRDARAEKVSPYAGVKAFPVEDEAQP